MFKQGILTLKRSLSSQQHQYTRTLATMSGLAPLDASKLKITKTSTPKAKLEKSSLKFGQNFTDHMLTIEWDAEKGWGTPEIKPYGNFSLDPATCVFHYAFELFEGMKAYKGKDGEILIFRPDKNMVRMNKSAERICLPTFDGEEFTKLMGELLKLDGDFIPEGRGYSLYLRPTLIGTDVGLGVGTPSKALLYCICSPAGPYYSTGFKPVSLLATDFATRAWPGGVGNRKLGANYAPCILPQKQAAAKGYQQNLWLFGEEKYITEVGTMNVFFVFEKDNGKKEIVTLPLDGTILEGVTRDSVIELCKEKLNPDEWEVSERYCTIFEVEKAAKEGKLVELFGTGTAAVVSCVGSIGWNGNDIKVPYQQDKGIGELTEKVANWIAEIQYGDKEHEWSRVIS